MTPQRITFLEFRFPKNVHKKQVIRVIEREAPKEVPHDAIGYLFYDALGFTFPDGGVEILGRHTNHSLIYFVDASPVVMPDTGDLCIRTRHGELIPFEACLLA